MEFCRILSSFGVCRGKLPCYRAVGGGGNYLPQRFANYIARGEHARFIGLHSLVANYVTRLVGLHKAFHKLGRRLVAKFYEQTAALYNAGGSVLRYFNRGERVAYQFGYGRYSRIYDGDFLSNVTQIFFRACGVFARARHDNVLAAEKLPSQVAQ